MVKSDDYITAIKKKKKKKKKTGKVDSHIAGSNKARIIIQIMIIEIFADNSINHWVGLQLVLLAPKHTPN